MFFNFFGSSVFFFFFFFEERYGLDENCKYPRIAILCDGEFPEKFENLIIAVNYY